jgi:hypothetical protein
VISKISPINIVGLAVFGLPLKTTKIPIKTRTRPKIFRKFRPVPSEKKMGSHGYHKGTQVDKEH